MALIAAYLNLLVIYITLANARPETPSHPSFHAELPECLRITKNCTSEFEQDLGVDSLQTFPEIRSFLSNDTMLTRAAEALQEAGECRLRASQMPSCREYLFYFEDDILLFSGMAEFLQSPGTIDNIVAVSSSPCLSSQEAFDATSGTAFSECQRGAERSIESGDWCGAVRNFFLCIEWLADRLCGEAAGQLIRRAGHFFFTRQDLVDLFTEEADIDLSSCQILANVARRSAELSRPLLHRFRK